MSALFDLSDKTALLTGASRGPSTARCSVGRDCALPLAANTGHKDHLETLVETTRFKGRPIDILIGNAGVNPYYGVTSKITDEAYEKTMKTNAQANLWLAQLVAPDMIAKSAGSMAFTSSIGAFKPSELLETYGVSKLALIGLVCNLAQESGPKGIRVNAICPGLVRTEFARELWDNPQVEDRIKSDIPLRRLGEADDFKGLAVFLASDASRYMTGQALTVRGGPNIWA